MVPVSSRTPQRRRRSRTAAAAAGVLLLALAGCTGEPAPEQPPVEPTAESTPLADYDTSELVLVPGDFCDLVDEDAIAEALADEAGAARTWQPGNRLPGSQDISNEFGCSWAGASTAARAWVFAPPTTGRRAADFARETVGKGCRRLTAAPGLGDPSTTQHCRRAGLTGVYGLVGDAWVGCEIGGLSGSGGDRTARVGEWCVAVVEALSTS